MDVEPSSELLAAHREVLSARSAPTPPTPFAASDSDGSTGRAAAPETASPARDDLLVPLPRPAQLPAAYEHFAGREAEIDHMLHRLPAVQGHGGPGTTMVINAIGGMAGVGKTTLAVQVAHRVADRFPDGQLYVNLRGFDLHGAAMDPAEAVRGFLEALGVSRKQIPDSLEAQAALYRSLLADRRVLVLLDNARDADQVRPLLPGAAGCLVLITSRNQLTSLVVAGGAHPLTLDLLSPKNARQSLVRRLGADRVAAEPAAVDTIISLCGGLPLALSIITARALMNPTFPLSGIAAELMEANGSLDAFDGLDAATDVRTVFGWSYRTLTGEAARLFRLLSLHPGPDIGTHAAAALADRPTVRVRSLLAELTRTHLLTEEAPGRYRFHDLLRAYANELARAEDGEGDSEEERRDALCRMLDHYLLTAHASAPPSRSGGCLPLADPVAGDNGDLGGPGGRRVRPQLVQCGAARPAGSGAAVGGRRARRPRVATGADAGPGARTVRALARLGGPPARRPRRGPAAAPGLQVPGDGGGVTSPAVPTTACLVRAGTNDGNRPVFVDLSRLDGVLSVNGEKTVARDVVQNLLAEIARTRPGTPVTVLRGTADAPTLAVPPSLQQMPQVTPQAVTAPVPAQGTVRAAAARRPLKGLVVVAGTPNEREATELAALCGPGGAGWTGLVYGEAQDAHWRWYTDGDGRVDIPVLDLKLTVPA
ncbi:NB-ARC domain-containing protein (plasmid) [Streptomyces sp. NBC_01450]|uniref:ATP-binding protein n=1 Tax=Streptomyces sp. NBC_01450 TaxID=2903871 RepID=UPI002E33FF6A|nr:NB-ARC domain-containing protein [Streptomyces sp. NBC_01450]